MITSKQLLDQTGISRATLNNYISLGLVPRPEVKRMPSSPGAALTTLGYFPDWTLDKIQQILTLKRQGLSMDAISVQFNQQNSINKPLEPEKNLDVRAQLVKHDMFEEELISAQKQTVDANKITSSETLEKRDNPLINNKINGNLKSLNISVDKINHPAYMINYDCGLIWLNDAAQQLLFANTSIPERAEDRSIIPTLLDWAKGSNTDEQQILLINHFNVLKSRLTKEALSKCTQTLDLSTKQWLEHCYDLASAPENTLVQESTFHHSTRGNQRIITISFREGVLFTYVPEKEDANQLLEWLSCRDSVIRTLLSQQLPVLTPLAALVADLQNSVRICAELPPEEYFQLINEVWSTLDPIFRKYYGAYGKHTGDGMVYYFFPQPDHNYLMNAILCACEIRETMKKISHAWSLKKGWTNQLYMNIGLNEGQEWLGTFKTNTSYELVVLGETMNICGRLSDFARLGKIWATKNLVSKLTPAERELIDYGVSRAGFDQELFVSKSYAQVSTLLNKDDPRSAKLSDISSSVVTEIRAAK